MPGSDKPVEKGFFLDLSDDDGVIATHIEGISFPKHVATSHQNDDHHSTIKEYLIPIACVNVPDGHFAFDSSFVEPHARPRFAKLARLFDELTARNPFERSILDPSPPLSVFGHADPSGPPPYNSILSARRAKAVYAVLVRDVDMWDDLFTNSHGGDKWGKYAIRTMIEAAGVPEGTPPNIAAKEPAEAATHIQHDKKLRRALFRKYMDAICVRMANGQATPFELEKKKHFLVRGEGKNGKGDLQGCGEFNLTLVLSKKKLAAWEKAKDKSGRNKENAPNRRVLIFLFKPGSRIDPKAWPCPNVGQTGEEAVKICQKRFWPDAAERKEPDPEEDKRFRKELPKMRRGTFGGTFRCRFYQGIAQDSPCEGIYKRWVLRVLSETPVLGRELNPLREKRFVAIVKDKPALPDSPEVLRIHGRTDSDGFLRLPAFDDKTIIELKLEAALAMLPKEESEPAMTAAPTPEEEKGFFAYKLDAGALRDIYSGGTAESPEGTEEDKKTAARQRLYNLGYGPDKLEKWDDGIYNAALKQFQENERIDEQGLGEETRARLKLEHDPELSKPQKKTDDEM